MKKVLSLLLVAVFALATTRAKAEPKRDDLVTEVNSCWAILQEFMGSPSTAIPPAVWQQARGILIVNQFKAGFLFGVKAGYGVVMVKKPSGWSIPVLIKADEASVGLQAGAKSVETIFIMTDDQTPRKLFNTHFDIGVDAKAVIGPKAADVEKDKKPILAAPVLVYTKEAGLFAGATFKADKVSRDDDANYVLYNTRYTMPELLYSDWVQPPPTEVQPLMAYLQQLAP